METIIRILSDSSNQIRRYQKALELVLVNDDLTEPIGAAVYGDSYIGKRLHHNLSSNGIEVRYFIDRNVAHLGEEILVYQLVKLFVP